MGRRKGGQRNNSNNTNNNPTNSVSREDPYHPLWDVHFDPLEDVPQFLRCTPTLQPRSPPASSIGSAGTATAAATTTEQREQRNRSRQEQPSVTTRSSLSPPPLPLSSATTYQKQRILEMEPDVIFDPPPPSSSPVGGVGGGGGARSSLLSSSAAFKNRDLSSDAPWLGLHLEQQTVIMNEFASERRKLREENELLRKMLEEAEDTIRALESNDSSSGSSAGGGGGGKSNHNGNNDGNDDGKNEDVVVSGDKKNTRKGGGGGGGGDNRTSSAMDELTCAQSVHSVYSDATTVVAGSASRPKVKVIGGGGTMMDGAQAVLPGGGSRTTRDRSPSLTDGDFCGRSPGDGGRRKKDRQENGAFPSLTTRQGGNDRCCAMKKKNRKSFLPMLRRSNSTGSMHDVFANPTYHGPYRKGKGNHKHLSLNATISDPSRRHSHYGEGEVVGPPKERIVGFGPEGPPPPATPARDAKSKEARGREGQYKRTAGTRSLNTKIDGVPKISSTGSSSSSSGSSSGNSEDCTNSPAPPTKRGIKVKVKKLSNWIVCSPARQQQPALGPVSTASSSASSSDGVPNHDERDNNRGEKEEISSPAKNKPARTVETTLYGDKSRGKKQPNHSGKNDNIDPTLSPRAVLDLREC